jgi:phosphate starvation-inducible PhoH-like protein
LEHTEHFTLHPQNNHQLLNVCGQYNEHLQLIEQRLQVKIRNRGFDFSITGENHNVKQAQHHLINLYQEAKRHELDKDDIHLALQEHPHYTAESHDKKIDHSIFTKIRARSPNQEHYVQNILSHDLNFGIGPAGTGKTFLAVACAVDALEKGKVQRIILVRPAVEAGEKLGFLPGDMAQKVDPYLRPLYDALFELLGVQKVEKLLEKGIIEIAPLAYMRGRTLNHAFIILDESQNTTVEQMKMFLTRIGFGSTAVVTGDITQIDLQRHQRSGLVDAIDVLDYIKEISFTFFNVKDVVRHPIVQRIIEAYDKKEGKENV